jgi:hypothetical protein
MCPMPQLGPVDQETATGATIFMCPMPQLGPVDQETATGAIIFMCSMPQLGPTFTANVKFCNKL